MSIILTPQQLEAYNRGEAVTIQKVKEVKREYPHEESKKLFFVDFNGEVTSAYFSIEYQWIWQNYMLFETPEELQKQMQYIEAVSYIRTYIANNFGEWKPDWENVGQKKLFLMYVTSEKKWVSEWWTDCTSPQPFPYLQTREDAEQLIRDCEPQLNILRDFWN